MSPERQKEHCDFFAKISDFAHLPEEIALLREYVYTEVEDRYSICNDQVTV
jgi:hypothetical protein